MDVRCLVPLLVAAASATAAEPPINPRQADPLDVYRVLDSDGNGLLTESEVRVIPALSLVFQQMDTNQSGQVDYREFSEYEPVGGPTTTAGTQGLDIEVLDGDGDDRVDRREAMAYAPLAERWAEFDRDSNGYIDRSEFNRFEAAMFGPIEQESGFQGLDTNGDGMISQEEAAENPQLVDRWLDLDRDESGTLDPGEFAAFSAPPELPPRARPERQEREAR